MSVANARLLAVLVLATGVSERAWPQSPMIPEVRGELHVPGVELHGYTVYLSDMNSHLETIEAEVDMSGTFRLRWVPCGEYAMRVRDGFGEVVRVEYITLSDKSGPLRIDVPIHERPRPVGGSVSVKQLQHPPSQKAVQAFVTAARLSESKQYERAAGELEKAVRLSPEFAEAYSNLAAQHYRMGLFEQAAAEARHAMELSTPNPRDLCNLALAQWSLGRRREALENAERALALDSEFVNAHFVVGSLLVMDPGTRAEGIRHLEKVAGAMPSAARLLERVRAAVEGH